MRKVTIGAISLLAVAVLSGCAPREGGSQDAVEPAKSPEASGSPEGVMMKEGDNKVSFLNLGAKAVAGRPMEVVWQVTPAEKTVTITHTAVHSDTVSHPGDFGAEVTPAASGYKELTPPITEEEISAPRAFTATLTPAAGTLYLRAHAIMDGKNYWTAEEQIAVVAKAEDVGGGDNAMKNPDGTKKNEAGAMVDIKADVMVGPKTFTLIAKQWEFSPKTITVKKGDRVKLTLKSVDVEHGFLLPEFAIDEKLKPGQTVTVEFTADKTGEFTFRCNVLCGSGHLDMVGKLIVQ